MKDIVNEALERSEEESNIRNQDTDDFDQFGDPRILVVGCGGAGNNTVNRLSNMNVKGAETIALNTDKQHLEMIEADTKILVGKSLTEGLGAGGDPEIGKKATQQSEETVRDQLEDADLVFVTAGMGGGTGTGAAPVVSKIAKDVGAIVVGMVSMPFDVEKSREKKAQEGLEAMNQFADSTIVLKNERLLDYVPNLPLGKAFSVMDQIISETVKGITETITEPSLINLDYADMRSIMEGSGVAVMLVGESDDSNNKEEVVSNALSNPLLDVGYESADGGLIHITGGPELTLKEAQDIAKGLTQRLDNDSEVIWGSRVDEEYQGKVQLMAIMTGVESQEVVGQSQNYTSKNGRSDHRETKIDTIR